MPSAYSHYRSMNIKNNLGLSDKPECGGWRPPRSESPVTPPFVHRWLGRERAEEVLRSRSVGTFLIRPSETDRTLALSLKAGDDRVLHLRIRQSPQKLLYIEANRNSEPPLFHSIANLVAFYQSQPFLASTGHSLILTHPLTDLTQ